MPCSSFQTSTELCSSSVEPAKDSWVHTSAGPLKAEGPQCLHLLACKMILTVIRSGLNYYYIQLPLNGTGHSRHSLSMNNHNFLFPQHNSRASFSNHLSCFSFYVRKHKTWHLHFELQSRFAAESTLESQGTGFQNVFKRNVFIENIPKIKNPKWPQKFHSLRLFQLSYVGVLPASLGMTLH